MALNIPKEVSELKDKIKAGLTVTVANGVAAAAQTNEKDNLYLATLPEGLTPEIINKVDTHDVHYVAACKLAAGEIGIDALTSNSDVKKATVAVDFHTAGDLTSTWTRTREYRNAGGQPGEKMIVHGEVRTVVHAVNNGDKAIAGARDLIASLTQAACEKESSK